VFPEKGFSLGAYIAIKMGLGIFGGGKCLKICKNNTFNIKYAHRQRPIKTKVDLKAMLYSIGREN